MLVIEGVPLANRKPTNPIHKVQRTTRVFIGLLQSVATGLQPIRHPPHQHYSKTRLPNCTRKQPTRIGRARQLGWGKDPFCLRGASACLNYAIPLKALRAVQAAPLGQPHGSRWYTA